MTVKLRPWLVIRIKPQQYARAAENVRNQATEFYCPRARIRRPRIGLRVEPLFPGYAFARPPSARWAYLRSTVGVLDVLRAGWEIPARRAEEDIARWRGWEGPDGLIRLESAEFRVGETVRVDHGAMSGLVGIVDGMPARERVYVLLEFLGHQTRTQVSVGDISRE